MKDYITYNKLIHNTNFISIIFIAVFFSFYANFIHSSSIERSIKEDTNLIAKSVFQNLYTVMEMGGNKEIIDKTINKINKNISYMTVSIVNTNNTKNEIIDKAFITKESQISKQNQTIKFATPILFMQECLKCHNTSQVDDVAGVIFIEHSILDIKFSLREILIMLFILFVLIITVFFTMWSYFLKKYFMKPINNLVEQICKYKAYKDLKNTIIIDSKIEEIKLLENAFNMKNKALLNSYQELKESSFIDSLTETYNRKKFDEYCTFIFNDAERYNHIFSIIVIDLDKFKSINDSYGHNIGDKVLIYFTQLINKSIRETDYLFRMGGDEFYLLLNNTSLKEGGIIVKKLQEKLLNSKFIYKNIQIVITASFGISQYRLDGNNIEELIIVADNRMYKNKKGI